MGQEAGKPAWPKPSGGYQTITGRKYERRHTCVSFRTSLNSQDRDEHQHEDCGRLEWENVQKDNSLRKCMSLCMCHLFANWDVRGGGEVHIEKCEGKRVAS